MNRFGKLLVGLFALLAIGFVLILRFGEKPPPPAAPRLAEPPRDLMVPVSGVASDKLTDTFDQRRDGVSRPHGALDIMADRGTPVIAAGAGTIEKLFESEAGGHTIYVRADGGPFIHYYAHLDSYARGLKEGQHVERGEPIGKVGSTGNADPAGPHLHFAIMRMKPGEAWHQGTPIDPYPWLAGRSLAGQSLAGKPAGR